MRQQSLPVDRVAAHIGGGVTLDWKESPLSGAASTASTWLATGGLDRTVKIWESSADLLKPLPIKTLHTSAAVQKVVWRPNSQTEIAVLPLSTASSSSASGGVESDSESVQAPIASAWKNAAEIWDLRREYVPKYAIRSPDGIVSCKIVAIII